MAKKSKKESSVGAASQTKKSIPNTAFTVEGKKYKFVVSQYIDSTAKVVTVEAALKDKAELERLVEIESGVISLA